MAEQAVITSLEGTPAPPPPPPSAPSATPNIPAEEYDLGPVNEGFEDSPADASSGAAVAETATGPASAVPATEAAPAPSTDRPRNADGTFAKPPRLVQMAQDVGMSEDEIASTPTAELRDAVLFEQQRAMMQAILANNQRAVQGDNQGNPPAEPAAEPGAQTSQQPASPAPQADPLAWARENLAPELYSLLEGMHRENQQLKAQLGQVGGHIQAQAARTATEECDLAFAQYPTIFGAGKFADYKANAPEMVRRNSVINLVKTMDKNLPLGQRVHQAVAALYPGTVPPVAAPAPGPTEEQWNQGGLTRPTNRRGSTEPRGYKRALQTAERVGREMGLYDESDEVLNGFPE